MKNEFENSSMQNKDTLLFLINEFFLNSNLSSIEITSEQQDNLISSHMNTLYQQLLALESIKAQFYDEKQFSSSLNFSTSTYTQSTSQVNNSPLNENYFKRLFNGESTALKNNKRKIMLKANANTTGKKGTLFHELCVTESNNNENRQRQAMNRLSQAKKPRRQDMSRTINYSTKNHIHSNRSEFRFEPKKKEIMNCIKNADIQADLLSTGPRGKSVNSITINNQLPEITKADSNKVITHSASPGALSALLSDNKNEAVIKKIFLFLNNCKSNSLRNSSYLARKIYLEELLNKTQKKIEGVTIKSNSNEGNTHDNHSKEIIDTSGSSSIDNKMEVEILKHIEAKLNEFLQLPLK